jgi:Fic family protein
MRILIMDPLYPQFTITPAILRDVAQLEAARQMIANASLIPAWERQFRQEAMIRQVYHSTHIEGNKLSFTEAQKVFLQDQTSPASKDRDVQEIINYRNVVKYIHDYKLPQLDGHALCLMHQLIVDRLLPSNQAGAYRQVEVAIINNQTQQKIFQPPLFTQVPELVDRFFTWLNSPQAMQLPAPLRAGIGHYELVRIHPFVDGNGRTTRVMAMLMLYQGGYDKQFFCLDEYYDKDASTYYQALQSANQTGDMTLWLEYFIQGLASEFDQVKQRVIDLSRDHALKKKFGQIALNDRQISLLKFIEEYGQIANTDWQELLPSVSDDTILRDIKDLITKKLLKKRGKTKAAYYVLR